MKFLCIISLLCCLSVAVTGLHSTPEQPPALRRRATKRPYRAPIYVDPATQRLRDSYNREVVFHGVNVVSKTFPFIPYPDTFNPTNSFSKRDMEVLQEYGMNAMRLGTMWAGIEPTRGQYNETYLSMLKQLVSDAADYDIHSLLDMHQDVLSPKFCGEGLPDWAARPDPDSAFPAPLHPPYNVSSDGIPSDKDCATLSWSTYYFTKATGSAFQAIYDNKYGLLDSFAAFWSKVASTMASLGDAVLGYNLMNEPWAGDAIKDILLMIPGWADKANLQPTWEYVSAAIRKVDPTHAIFFESVTWDWFNVGFTQSPGGAEWRNKSVLSYHFYIPPDFSAEVQFAARAADMKRLQCGGMLTEFSTNEPGLTSTPEALEQCDKYFQSWLFWDYKSYANDDGTRRPSRRRLGRGQARAQLKSNPMTSMMKNIEGVTGSDDGWWYPNGTMNMEIARSCSRTYAQAIAGHGILMHFNTTTYEFILQYSLDLELVKSTQTVIYHNAKLFYPKGISITAECSNPKVSPVHNQTGNYIYIDVSETNAKTGDIVTVKLHPKE